MLYQRLNQTFQDEKDKDDDAFDESDTSSDDDSESTSEDGDKEIEHGEIIGQDIPLVPVPGDDQVVPSDVAPAPSPGSQPLPGPSHTASAEEHLRLGLS